MRDAFSIFAVGQPASVVEGWKKTIESKISTNEEAPDLVEAAVTRTISEAVLTVRALWLRSPAAQGTLRRAAERYIRFVRLAKLHLTTTLVPTLDVDFVWRTERCSLARHVRYLTAKIGGKGEAWNVEPMLVEERERAVHGSGMTNWRGVRGQVYQGQRKEWWTKTGELFRMRFGAEYARCLCWDCEAMLEEVEAADKSEEGEVDFEKSAVKVADDVAYYREVERHRRAKRSPPTRQGMVSRFGRI
jgi:hypothetical protein